MTFESIDNEGNIALNLKPGKRHYPCPVYQPNLIKSMFVGTVR